MPRLSGAELEAAVAPLAGWSVEEGEGAISKRFAFGDFESAFSFMTAVALKAARLDHHPEWANVYSSVDVRLTSHDSGGVTERDITLARFMDGVATRLSSPGS